MPELPVAVHRVTVSIPEEVDEKIRRIQGEIIANEGRSMPFVEVLFDLVREGLVARGVREAGERVIEEERERLTREVNEGNNN